MITELSHRLDRMQRSEFRAGNAEVIGGVGGWHTYGVGRKGWLAGSGVVWCCRQVRRMLSVTSVVYASSVSLCHSCIQMDERANDTGREDRTSMTGRT